MKDRRWLRIAIETLAVLALHAIGLYAMASGRVLEHVLSPAPGAGGYLGAAVAFLLLRFFVVLFLPGWVLARVWLGWVGDRMPAPAGREVPESR